MSSKPKVAIIGTGGTIAGVGADRLDLHDYGTTGRFMHVEELIASVPELDRVAEHHAGPLPKRRQHRS